MARKTRYEKRDTSFKGFSLYELMVAVAFLSFGLIVIYESFFITADVAKSMPNYLTTQIMMDEMIWESEALLRENGYLFPAQEYGVIESENKTLQWDKKISVLDHKQGLYEIEVGFTWKAGGKPTRNFCTTYIRK